MEFSIPTLVGGFVFGIFGVYFIKQGRSRGNIPWILVGVAQCIYPFFVFSALPVWGIGLGLSALAYFWRN